MLPDQEDGSRIIRGALFGFLFSVPVYLALGALGFAMYHLWRLVFG